MSENEKVLELLSKSQLAFSNGKFEVSLSIAREALKIEKSNPDVFVCIGNSLIALNRHDEACKSYRFAVSCDAKNPKLLLQYGFALMSNGETAKGFEILSQAKEIVMSNTEQIEDDEKDDLLNDKNPKDNAQKVLNNESNDLLFQTLGMYCFDNGNFKDALVNFSQIRSVSLEVLERKAVIYGIENNIREGLNTANQIKLLRPTAYLGYQLAFGLLTQIAKQASDTAENALSETEKTKNTSEKEKLIKRASEHFEIRDELLKRAKIELEKAKKFAQLEMDYYFESLSFEVQQFGIDNNVAHLKKALGLIDTGLKNIQVTPLQVIESYVNAAEVYLQLANNGQISYDEKQQYFQTAISCLNAASDPVFSFNHGFSVLEIKMNEQEQLESGKTETAIDKIVSVKNDSNEVTFGGSDSDSIFFNESDDDNISFDTGENNSDINEGANTKGSGDEYLTEIPDIAQSEKEKYKIEDTADFDFPKKLTDQINGLYITIYIAIGDFQKVIEYAKVLKLSDTPSSRYLGRYTEVSAAKKLSESPETIAKQYEELIKYFKRQAYIDQADIIASFYLASCYIDTEQFDEVDKLCELLHPSFRVEIEKAIAEAKSQK